MLTLSWIWAVFLGEIEIKYCSKVGKPFQGHFSCHRETIQLICNVKQLTGFYKTEYFIWVNIKAKGFFELKKYALTYT